MTDVYSPKETKLTPAIIPQDALIAIARLVRAFAEIDDLINLYICCLAQITEGQAVVLLGRTPASTKLNTALYLGKMTSKKLTQIHNNTFNAGYRSCRKCRNAVAHGVFLGETDEGRLAFLTSETTEPTNESAIQIVISYNVEAITEFADLAEASIPIIIKRLQLGPLRDRRLGRPLQPHRKGLPQQLKKKKPPRPLKSSPGK